MTLIVEDGSGLTAAESYSSVAEIDTYLAAYRFPPPTAWFGMQATGKLTLIVQPAADEAVVVGARTYTFKSALTSSYQVLIGATSAATRQNLTDAVNGVVTTGVGTGTVSNPDVEATGVQGFVVNVRSKVAGVGGNTFPTTTTMANVNNTWASVTLVGGVDAAVSTDDKEAHARIATRWVESRVQELMDGEGYAVQRDQALILPLTYIIGKNGNQLQPSETVALVKPSVAIMALRSAEGDDLTQDLQDSAALVSKSISAGPGGVSIDKTWGASGETAQKDYALARDLLYQAFGAYGSRVYRA